ncbi:MAG: DUF3467 domain-containing protein [bacterium]|nr:DUF3467 domain-containing protein [bacterium]MDT8395229.1 DUF3467 domain-containing protein [bacterium]
MPEDRKAIIHIDPAEETGRYANAATIMHSTTEFIVDFIMLLPGDRRKVVSRIVTSPAHAKQLATALAENVARFEKIYGQIEVARAEVEFSGSMN